MTRILLVETASPKRICHKLEQILRDAIFPEPEISILCYEGSRAAYPDYPGITIYSLADHKSHQIPKEIQNNKFDVIYFFWTGEKRYRQSKLLALRLKAAEIFIVGGDGNEFRLTWKAICRHVVFRWRHPLPTDHWDFALPYETNYFGQEQVLILQTAEPPYILQALQHLKEHPVFRNPRYTLFCRNRPEIVDVFRTHASLDHIRIHSETRGSWKHLRELRRSRFDAAILFLTGDPSYWKLKIFAFMLGVPRRRMLIVNESGDSFFFNWSQWFGLIIHRMQSQPMPGISSNWRRSARILVSLFLKSVMLPFRFLWLLLVWLRLRSAGLRFARKNHDDSSRLPLFPGI
jgi:hypothetical protein